MAARSDFEPEAARATRRLRTDILDGARAPGSRLVERELATELGVSRVPVRDALRALAAEGLVTLRPRTWAVVREFTAGDVADLIEVRTAFEALTFSLAAQRRTSAGLGKLRRILDEELSAAEAGDAVRARRRAADFHETVTELAANDVLTELEHVMRSRLRWLLAQHDDLLRIAAEHETLYAAIAERDSAGIDALVRAHLETSRGAAAGRVGGPPGR